MPYAPAFIRSAPPTVPGTPMSPSMPPRTFLAQKVTVRPRSAAASTCAKVPSITTSGSGLASWSTTQGNSPSPTSKFEPPPRNRWGMPLASSKLSKSGMPSCFLMRRRSVVPPIPSEVRSESVEPLRNSTPSSGKAAAILGLSMRMGRGVLRSEQNHKLVAGAADVARADGEDGVAGASLAQQVLDALVHRRKVEDVLMPGFTNGAGEGFARHSGDSLFAGGVDVGQDDNVGEIKGAAE